MDDLKTCTKCKTPKPPTVEYFERRKQGKGGLSPRCKDCLSAARKEARENNPGLDSEYKARWRKKQSAARTILIHTRHRASKLGIPFDLEEEDIFVPDVCPVLGIPLDTSVGTKGGIKPNSPSIDKIEPGKGYVKGNIQIISNKANTMKHNATADELIAFADWVYKTFGETR